MAEDPVLAVAQQRSRWDNVKRDLIIYGAQGGDNSMAQEATKRFKSRREREYMMVEDDMSFMAPVFMDRQLPYPEYLVECGYHPITKEILNRGVNKSVAISAMGDMMRKYGLHFSAKYEIPCKGGAVFNVSVISGKMFYSRTDAPYEISGPYMRDKDEDDESSDPLGYQTDEQLMLYLAKLIVTADEY